MMKIQTAITMTEMVMSLVAVAVGKDAERHSSLIGQYFSFFFEHLYFYGYRLLCVTSRDLNMLVSFVAFRKKGLFLLD